MFHLPNRAMKRSKGVDLTMRGKLFWELVFVFHFIAPDLNLLEELRSAMAQNPHLQVLVADGIYDKLYFWPNFTFAQFDFNPELRARVKIATYESGHMMYIHGPSLVKMKDDMAGFIQSAVSQ